MDFDLQLAIECVDSFFAASGLGCALTDKNGKILHKKGYSCADCKICMFAGRDGEVCRGTRQYGLHASERFGGKYIYFCAMGLTCFTSPILGPNGEAAQLMVGPFLMVEPLDYISYDLHEMTDLTTRQKLQIEKEVNSLPYVDAPRVTGLSNLLFMSVAFMNNVSESNRMMEMQENTHIQGQISDYVYQLKRQESKVPPYPFRTERRFLQALTEGEKATAQKFLNELLGYIMFSFGGDINQTRTMIYDLLVLMSRALAETGEEPNLIQAKMAKYRQEIQQYSDMSELNVWLSKVVRQLMDSLLKDRTARHTDIVHRTMQYIRTHYAEKITLTDMAKNIYMSPTYLSRIFKRDAGLSVVDYLNRIRIEKSKEMMMKQSVRLIEVALQCGFESQSYFTRMFKQYTGVTPQQFQKNVQNADKQHSD